MRPTLILLFCFQSFLIIAQKATPIDTAQELNKIKSLYQNIENNRNKFTKQELFLSKLSSNDVLVPFEKAVYIGEGDPNDIIYYTGSVLFLYQSDTLSALDEYRVFVYTDSTNDVKLIHLMSHDDPEGSSVMGIDFYMGNDLPFFSYKLEINTNYWSTEFKETKKETRYYYADKNPIRCLEKEKTYPLNTVVDFSKVRNQPKDINTSETDYYKYKTLIESIQKLL